MIGENQTAISVRSLGTSDFRFFCVGNNEDVVEYMNAYFAGCKFVDWFDIPKNLKASIYGIDKICSYDDNCHSLMQKIRNEVVNTCPVKDNYSLEDMRRTIYVMHDEAIVYEIYANEAHCRMGGKILSW